MGACPPAGRCLGLGSVHAGQGVGVWGLLWPPSRWGISRNRMPCVPLHLDGMGRLPVPTPGTGSGQGQRPAERPVPGAMCGSGCPGIGGAGGGSTCTSQREPFPTRKQGKQWAEFCLTTQHLQGEGGSDPPPPPRDWAKFSPGLHRPIKKFFWCLQGQKICSAPLAPLTLHGLLPPPPPLSGSGIYILLSPKKLHPHRPLFSPAPTPPGTDRAQSACHTKGTGRQFDCTVPVQPFMERPTVPRDSSHPLT